MQTIILAGGEGTRLRPLTADTPKPLVKIIGESAIERLLRRLRSSGIRSATLCTCFQADKLKDALGTQCRGVRLKYCREEVPLGTAGCVRSAWNGDDVLVLSGDGVSGFDYKAILDFHRDSGADVTIVAREVDDPREYGLLTVDREHRITGFLEKPGYDECLTNLANTGAYVLSKEVIQRIPEGEKVDFARDVFPSLLSEGKKLCAFTDHTYWYDIGDIPSLLQCQRELLQLDGIDNLIEDGASVADDAIVLAGSVIERDAAVGKNSRIMASLISEGACVAADADISEALICKNVTAGEGLIMKRFSALGQDCVVGSNVTIESGARVAPKTKIPDGAIIRTDISAGEYSALSFGENGEAHGLYGAQDILRFGMAVGSALGLDSVAIGGGGEGDEALSLGFRAVGTTVYSLGGASFGETVFCARKLECSHCVFIDGEIRLISSVSASLTRMEERKIEQAYNRSVSLESKHSAPMIDGAAVSNLYLKHLRSMLPQTPQINAVLRTDSVREAQIFSELWKDSEGEKVTFMIASDRRTVTALTEESVIPYESLLILCCKAHFQKRMSVILPPRAPLSCDKLAQEYRSSVIRSTGKRELTAFSYDPLELIFDIAAHLTERGISLAAAIAELPQIVYTKRIIEAPDGLPKIMSEGFEGAKAGSDIMLESGGARAFVRPLKSGKAVSLYIESVSQEAASELSADIVRRLRGKLDNGEHL